MNKIFFALITLAIIVATGYGVYVLIELKSFIKTAREFLKTTDNNIQPTLEEIQKSLISIRHVTDNINTMTDDVKTLTSSIREVSENVRTVSKFISFFISPKGVQVSALKTGIRAGLEYAAKNFSTKNKEE